MVSVSRRRTKKKKDAPSNGSSGLSDIDATCQAGISLGNLAKWPQIYAGARINESFKVH